MEALDEVVKSGKARYIGASSMWAWQFAKYQLAAERMGTTKFVSMQDQVSLTYREEEREMLPLCKADGIGVIPWGPLNAGKLTRPWAERGSKRVQTDSRNSHMYDDATNKGVVDAVEQLAKARGVPMAQIGLAWVLAKPEVTAPIVGVTKVSQLDDAIGAIDVKLTAEEIAALEAPYTPIKVTGF
jgi:aryl-alcohol dehydrogenase-like predicted oxidoreductase